MLKSNRPRGHGGGALISITIFSITFLWPLFVFSWLMDIMPGFIPEKIGLIIAGIISLGLFILYLYLIYKMIVILWCLTLKLFRK